MANQATPKQQQQLPQGQGQAQATPLKTFQYKLVLLGESAVGKSSLVLRFVKGQFHEYQESTIGAAFLTQSITLDDAIIKFEIWDTAGQERYHSLAPMYYRGAQAAIVMYDITNRDSFSRAQTWISELQKQASPSIIMAVAANKTDLESLRSVTTEEGESFAKEHGLLFLETSAKNSTNVNEIFISIAKKLPRVATTTQGGARGQGAVNLEGEQRSNSSGGCCN